MMIELLKNSVEVLKQRVRYNLSTLHEYQDKVKRILKEPISSDRSERLNQQFSLSKKILQENNDAIKLQREITTYLESFQNDIVEFNKILEINKQVSKESSDLDSEVLEISMEDYFDLTVQGGIIFDAHHPYFKDENFINELLAHFIQEENYEMCSQLMELDRSKDLSETGN